MKKNILLRTNVLVCVIILVGFAFTAVLSYQANYSASLQNVEQVSSLTSEGMYYQLAGTFTKPVNVSLTMANDSLLKDFLSQEEDRLEDEAYEESIREYLNAYREKYRYDSVFLVSEATKRYYNFNGLDRVLTRGDPENEWYYRMLESSGDYTLVVDNDEVAGAENMITVFVNCKIYGDSGRELGVVGVGVRVSDLQELLRSYEKEFSVNAFLVDDQGSIEISTEYTGYEKADLIDVLGYEETARDQILDWKEEGEAKSFWTSSSSGDSFVVTRYIPELDWHLVVDQNTGPLLDKMRRQVAQTVLVILLIIGVILLVITCVIRSFNRQIVSLTQSTEQERRSVFMKATEQLYENIYELDITHNRPANQATVQYFESLGVPPGTPYDKALRVVAEKQIKAEYRTGYVETFSPEHVWRAYEQGMESLQYELPISTDGKHYYWMKIIARMVKWESDGSLHMLTYRQNIDAEKRQQRRMLELAQTDEMTGLYTKSASEHRISYALKKAPERLCAFFIFDIDNFKQANDLYGHSFGDGVILEFVQILRSNFRKDDLLGRIGGDEFVAFLPVPDVEWVKDRASVLSSELDRTFSKDGNSWHMTASIGVAFSPWDAREFDALYQKADFALYETKKHGRNGYTLYHGTGEEQREDL